MTTFHEELEHIRTGRIQMSSDCCDALGGVIRLLKVFELAERSAGTSLEILDLFMATICSCVADRELPPGAPIDTDAITSVAVQSVTTWQDMDPAGPRTFSVSKQPGGEGVARRLQDRMNALGANYLKTQTPTLDFIAPTADIGVYPFDVGKFGFNPAELSYGFEMACLSDCLMSTLSGGAMYDGDSSVVQRMATLDDKGLRFVNGVPIDRRDLPSYDEPEGQNAGPFGALQVVPYPITGIAARSNGGQLLNEDPAASFYMHSLGILNGDDLASRAVERLMVLLWVIENKRAELLPAFTLGPYNMWLGRSALSGYAGKGKIISTWTDVEDFLVYPMNKWLDRLHSDIATVVDPALEILKPQIYKSGKLPGRNGFSYDDVIDVENERNKWFTFLRNYSDLNAMHLSTEDVTLITPDAMTGPNLAGTLFSKKDAYYRRAAELKVIPPPIPNLEPWEWEKRLHDKQLQALMGGLTFGLSLLATVATMGAGAGIAAGVGGAVSSILGAGWKTFGSYVTSAWTSITQSGVPEFMSRFAVPQIVSGLQMTNNKVPPFLKEVGGWTKMNSKDIEAAYAKWATQTSDWTKREGTKLLTPPSVIKM